MKKIGKQVLFLETGERNPRNGEGGFLVAYYHSNGGDYTLNCLKIAKVCFDEIAK